MQPVNLIKPWSGDNQGEEACKRIVDEHTGTANLTASCRRVTSLC